MPQIVKQTVRTSSKPSGKSAVDRIAPIGFNADDGLKLLIYGKSGTGKTTLSATFDGPILWIVCSGGDQPGELRSIDTPEYRKKVSQIIIQHTNDIKEIIDHVKETSKYTTIVLDHGSGLQDLALKEVLQSVGKLPPDGELPAQKSWGMAAMQEYGTAGLMTKEILRALLGCRGNVIILAQERTFGGKEDGQAASSDLIQPVVGASFTPSVMGWLGPAVDYVVQTFLAGKTESKVSKLTGGKEVTTTSRVKGCDYCLRTGPHELYMTKFRMPRGSGKGLPEYIIDPSAAKILKLIKG